MRFILNKNNSDKSLTLYTLEDVFYVLRDDIEYELYHLKNYTTYLKAISENPIDTIFNPDMFRIGIIVTNNNRVFSIRFVVFDDTHDLIDSIERGYVSFALLEYRYSDETKSWKQTSDGQSVGMIVGESFATHVMNLLKYFSNLYDKGILK